MNSHAERNAFLDNLLARCDQTLSEEIKETIDALREGGGCTVGGPDEKVRPVVVGLQNLFEKTVLAMRDSIEKADFEIHTTIPSTPCCKLPDETTQKRLLAAFADDARLLTIDQRGETLDQICTVSQFTLHLTYTKSGYEKRSDQQKAAFEGHWKRKVHATCIEACEEFSAELSGATYRVHFGSGTQLFFGIRYSQAIEDSSRGAILHLGTADQEVIQKWFEQAKKELACHGRTLFAG